MPFEPLSPEEAALLALVVASGPRGLTLPDAVNTTGWTMERTKRILDKLCDKDQIMEVNSEGGRWWVAM